MPERIAGVVAVPLDDAAFDRQRIVDDLLYDAVVGAEAHARADEDLLVSFGSHGTATSSVQPRDARNGTFVAE